LACGDKTLSGSFFAKPRSLQNREGISDLGWVAVALSLQAGMQASCWYNG